MTENASTVCSDHSPDTYSSPGFTARYVVTIAMTPIAYGLSTLIIMVAVDLFHRIPFGESKLFHLSFATIWVCASGWIWRRVIFSSATRVCLTLAVGALPLLLIAYDDLLLRYLGKRSSEFLQLGPFHLGVGLCIWAALWIWSRSEKPVMPGDIVQGASSGLPFSPTAKRLIASLAVWFILFGVFMISHEVFRSLPVPKISVPVSLLITAVIGVAIWYVIWCRAFDWRKGALLQTTIATVVCLVLPLFCCVAFYGQMGRVRDIVLGRP